ncbi:uncharacterized protein LOC110687714 [Chenopodium quinoa]|uniref:uncharacterized protein LOC110687714 n=1 Tax=Chenopodium quinoa TaxID=63459 RepID=UPI000B7747F0|nr:uncharacterized protein LOC110687714 [Chenopodium quinoa]
MSEGRRVVQQFLHLSRQSLYIYWVMADELDVLQHAFMVHPITVNILRTYPHVIGMDSTYKTNRYGVSFFEIVGVTPTNQNFLVGYVFMRNDCTASYQWVLQRLRELIGYDKEPSVFLSDRELGLCSLDTVWARVHCHIGNQIIEICNGLEASRSKIGEKYRQLPLSRINGKVSQHCLKILDDETTRMRELSYQVYEHCGCAMRVTHGLPCAFQIHDSLVAQSGLYIRQIHPFWKTLVIGDGVDIPVFVDDSTEEAAHFRSLVDEVIGSDPAILRNVSRIIEEELHPHHTNLEEPHVNHNVRGRRRNNDTKRDPYNFEHVNRRNSQRGTQQTGTTSGPIVPYITAWKDVIGNGNCGFRCVADFFFGDQAQWFTARETIANEVAAYPMLYERIYGIGRVGLNIERIRWDGGAVDMRRWM